MFLLPFSVWASCRPRCRCGCTRHVRDPWLPPCSERPCRGWPRPGRRCPRGRQQPCRGRAAAARLSAAQPPHVDAGHPGLPNPAPRARLNSAEVVPGAAVQPAVPPKLLTRRRWPMWSRRLGLSAMAGQWVSRGWPQRPSMRLPNTPCRALSKTRWSGSCRFLESLAESIERDCQRSCRTRRRHHVSHSSCRKPIHLIVRPWQQVRKNCLGSWPPAGCHFCLSARFRVITENGRLNAYPS